MNCEGCEYDVVQGLAQAQQLPRIAQIQAPRHDPTGVRFCHFGLGQRKVRGKLKEKTFFGGPTNRLNLGLLKTLGWFGFFLLSTKRGPPFRATPRIALETYMVS